MCDQISDAILDACLKEDSSSRVACETATKTGLVMLLGEISTRAKLDYQNIVRGVIKSTAEGVIITLTFAPSLTSKRIKNADLYAAILPDTPIIIFLPRSIFKN